MLTREQETDLPELGHLVLHVRRELRGEFQPLAYAYFLLRERPEGSSRSMTIRPRSGCLRRGSWFTATSGRIRRDDCPTIRGFSARRIFPSRSSRWKIRGIFRGSAARSRSGPAGTPARCPNGCWAGSSRRAACPTSWCWIRSPAAARPWRWPRSLAGNIFGYELSKQYAEQAQERLKSIQPGDPLEGVADPVTSASDDFERPPFGRSPTRKTEKTPGEKNYRANAIAGDFGVIFQLGPLLCGDTHIFCVCSEHFLDQYRLTPAP